MTSGDRSELRPAGERTLDPLLVVEDLAKVYHLGHKVIEVLRGVSFTLRRGEMVAVVGRSGAGKSTLLHMLGTLDAPTRGKILIHGEDVLSFTPQKLAVFRNQTIGFVFQFHHLLPELTALENTMMPALIQRVPLVQAAEMAREMLLQVGLGDRLEHRPVELSGGEQQRVALARALVLKPGLLLADEPTGNLDEQTAEEVHELLFRLNRSLNMTTLVVTHNPRLAERLDRKLFLRSGRIDESGGLETRPPEQMEQGKAHP